MAISDLWNFEFFTFKISKNYFLKKVPWLSYKSKILKIFKKPEYMLELDIFNHHGKFQTNVNIWTPKDKFSAITLW